MSDYNLGKISKVELREVWKHEAHDFTEWLAREENLKELGDEIGIELELLETESSVGSFSVDIYAQEACTERKVVIENQLTETNHDHLGKVITYAAGKGAEVIIWLVARAREEHRQAIEWLNQHTDNDFAFFLIEIELLKIGESQPAPCFKLVEQPNDWSKNLKLSEGLPEVDRAKLSYWTKFREAAESSPSFCEAFNLSKPSKKHWYSLRFGSHDMQLCLLLGTGRERIGIEVCVYEDKEIGHAVIENTDKFEAAIGIKADPYNAKRSSGIRLYKSNRKIIRNEAHWNDFIREQMDWAIKVKGVLDELGL